MSIVKYFLNNLILQSLKICGNIIAFVEVDIGVYHPKIIY